MVSLKRKAFLGSLWTFAGFGAGQILRLGSNLILTRLLAPELFGAMAVVNSLRNGFALLSDFGIRQSIVQHKHGHEEAFVNTAWTIEVLRGFLIFLICCCFAIPAVKIYGNDNFYWLMPVVGLSALILGFQSTGLLSLRRKVNTQQEIIFELATQVISLIVMIIWALISPTLLSLAVGGIAGALFKTIGSYILFAEKRNKFLIHKESAKEIIKFGKWLFVATTFVFLAEQSDRLILGNLLSLDLLGVYSIAVILAGMPRQVIKRLANQVIFPVISRRADTSRESLRKEILKNRQKLLLLFTFILLPFIVCGDQIILFLYDDRYIQATWMLPILAIGVWFSVLFNTLNPCLMGIGKPVYGAVGNLLRFSVISIGLFAGFRYGGTLGAVIAVACGDFSAYLGIQIGLVRERLSFLSQDALYTLILFGLAAGLIAIRVNLGWGTPFSILVV